MTAMIVDDELYCAEALYHLLARYCPLVEPATIYTDPQEAVIAYKQHPPDILFLDVEMPFMSGFDFLNAIHPATSAVIFTTAYDTYAVQAFKVNAVDYLLKPIDKADLMQAIGKVAAKPQPINEQMLSGLIRSALAERDAPRKITIHTVEGIHLLPLEDILYCTSEGSYSFIHLRDQAPLMVSKNLSELEAMIQSSRFFRVHKSHLINQDHILKVNKAEGGDVLMSNHEKVPISRQRRAEFFEWLAR